MGDLLIVDTGDRKTMPPSENSSKKRFEAKEVYIPNGDNEFCFPMRNLARGQSSSTVVLTSLGNLREHFQKKKKRGPRSMSRF